MIFFLRDTNINILDNGHNILDKYKDMSKRKSQKVCTNLFYFRFQAKHPTRTTCHISTLIDHIITIYEEKVAQISLFFVLGKSRE